MSQIPPKETYKLSEVCRYTDTQPYVLRFWESEFPQLNPAKSGNQKVYSKEDLDLVQRIKHLLYEENCTLASARRKLEDGTGSAKAPAASPPPLREVAPPPAPAAVALPDAAESGAVSRQRYEDAIDEIDHLRLQVKEAEKAQRKAEAAMEKSQQELERCRARAASVGTRLEKLLEGLS